MLIKDLPQECDTERAENREFQVSRECRWFTPRYFNRWTLSGDRARYVLVDESSYGIVWSNVGFFILGHYIFFYDMWYLFKYRILG